MESKLNIVKFMLMDESDLNIWTLRFTKTGDYIKLTKNPNSNSPIIEYLLNLKESQFPKIVCYLETSKTGKEHYHMRIGSTIWQTRKSLFDSIHKKFPYLKDNAKKKGNAVFSTKAVRVKGKLTSSLEKSITYISKDKNLIYSRGYSQEALEKFQEIGSAWIDIKKLPIFEQIIHQHSIDASTPGKHVCRAILDYYKSEGRDPPTYFNLTKCLSNIKLKVDSHYRELYLMRGAQFYDNLKDNLYNG